jgi:hypothetical protein
MVDSPTASALAPDAPEAERYDATAELTKSALSLRDQLFGTPQMREVYDLVNEAYQEQDLAKAQNVIPGPWGDRRPKKEAERGPRSVQLDEYQIVTQGGAYWERPGALSFDAMASMVQQTPILNAIIQTRQRQVLRFCRPQISDAGPGFKILHVDPNFELGERQQQSVQLLQKFMLNCGWEFDPRRRKRLKRDNFGQFMAKSVRDSLIYDCCAIETEFKLDRGLGLDGFYAVDGSSIRLCTEEGYEGDDEIFAVQVLQGQIRAAFNYDQLIYEVRNPTSSVLSCGYGYSETEMLIKVVTYLLNTLTYNASFFDKNTIPRGFLNLYGSYQKEDLVAFKRYWRQMVSGAANHHNLPVMVSKDMEAKADYVQIDGAMDEMSFSRWLTFLTSVACAIYGVAPEDISMASFSDSKSALSGDDTEEKLTSSNDKGLRPLLGFYENVFSDFVVQVFSEDYMFRFAGLDEDDKKTTFEAQKIGMVWNEMRQKVGLDALDGPLGDMPVNAALIPTWSAQTGIGQPEEPQEDFGDPSEFPEDAGADDGDADADADYGPPPADDAGAEDGNLTKGGDYGLPVFTI